MSDLKQRSVDGIIWNLIANYGNQIFNVLIGVILARLLMPEDYGLIGIITVLFVLAMTFVKSGFGSAFIQKRNADEVDASTVFFFSIFISVFFYIIFWFTAPFIASFYEQKLLVNLIRVSALILIINSFGIMQNVKLTKEVNFKKKTLISLVSTIISGVAGIVAALNNFGVWSLVLQQVTYALFNVVGLWLFYYWRPMFIFSFSSLKSMFSFGSWILMSGIIRTIFDNIYVLVIGKYFPMSELGFYSKAKSYRTIVMAQPTAAISTVAFPVFSNLQMNKIALKNSMKKFMTHVLFFILPVASILIVIANPLIFLVLTEKWMPMVPYFQLLLVVGLFFPVHKMNLNILNAQGKSRLNFNLSLIKNTLRIVNIFIMYRYGVLFIIYGEILTSIIALFINGYYTNKFINYGTFEQLKDMSPILMISFISILIGFLSTYTMSDDYLKIIVGFFVTGSSYVIFQYFFNKILLMENIELLRSKFIK